MRLEAFRKLNESSFDWYADADVPSDWPVHGPDWWIRFVYYDCSRCLTERETELYQRGYDFDCYVELINDDEHGHCEWELAHFPAPWAEAAEELLRGAADALYGKE